MSHLTDAAHAALRDRILHITKDICPSCMVDLSIHLLKHFLEKASGEEVVSLQIMAERKPSEEPTSKETLTEILRRGTRH